MTKTFTDDLFQRTLKLVGATGFHVSCCGRGNCLYDLTVFMYGKYATHESFKVVGSETVEEAMEKMYQVLCLHIGHCDYQFSNPIEEKVS